MSVVSETDTCTLWLGQARAHTPCKKVNNCLLIFSSFMKMNVGMKWQLQIVFWAAAEGCCAMKINHAWNNLVSIISVSLSFAYNGDRPNLWLPHQKGFFGQSSFQSDKIFNENKQTTQDTRHYWFGRFSAWVASNTFSCCKLKVLRFEQLYTLL